MLPWTKAQGLRRWKHLVPGAVAAASNALCRSVPRFHPMSYWRRGATFQSEERHCCRQTVLVDGDDLPNAVAVCLL